MIPLLEAIAEGWSWKIGKPEAIVATNRFGNVIVRNTKGHYFLIIPKERRCELLAVSAAELEEKRNGTEFIHDWEMRELAARAETSQGRLDESQVYCLIKNKFRKADLRKLLSDSGNTAREIEDIRKKALQQPRSPKLVFGLIKKHKMAVASAYMLPVAGALLSSVIDRPPWIELIMPVMAAVCLSFFIVPDLYLGVAQSGKGIAERSSQPVRYWLSISILIGFYILISIFPILFALQEAAKRH